MMLITLDKILGSSAPGRFGRQVLWSDKSCCKLHFTGSFRQAPPRPSGNLHLLRELCLSRVRLGLFSPASYCKLLRLELLVEELQLPTTPTCRVPDTEPAQLYLRFCPVRVVLRRVSWQIPLKESLCTSSAFLHLTNDVHAGASCDGPRSLKCKRAPPAYPT